MDRGPENTNLEVDQKMTRHKRTADPDTDQRTKFCRASPTTSAQTDSTERRDKRLKRRIDVTQERKDEQKKPARDDKGRNRNEPTPSRSELTCPPRQWISLKRILNVENSLVFGMEMLPAFSKTSHCFSSSSSSSSSLPASLPSHTASSSSLSVSQAHKSMDQRHGPNLSFLPPIDKGLFALLRDANFYCGTKAYTTAVGSLNTALQLVSKGHVLNDMRRADPDDINLVISNIQARLVVCYLRMKKPLLALEHGHRSALTADWLYCLLGGTERHISTQLKLYWQAMLFEAQTKVKDIVSVMYTSNTGVVTNKDISQAEETFVKHHPTFTDFIFTGVFRLKFCIIQFN
ncbi:spermatogenesis-associated protein 16-like isoform X5 [Scomber scombrus]|uniref:Spermatogenesis-associated protein 16-like isoform X5 n=1 Tax=Scomber scombrus TaxID=13677 RepID=A0AAV1PDU4_SCOSC